MTANRRGLQWVEHVRATSPATTGQQTVPPRVALARGRRDLAIAIAALGLFVVLFTLVRGGHSARTDHRMTIALQQRRSPRFKRLMEVVSWPGFPPQSRLLPPLLASGWLILGFPLEALFQALAWGTGGISFTVKRVMRRPRPNHPEIAVAIARIGGSSFPSGHVLNYMGVYGFLSYLLASLVRPARLRRTMVGALIALLGLVGPSRIYLGHHWASDVSASYLLGTTYLIGLTTVYRRVKTWVSGV